MTTRRQAATAVMAAEDAMMVHGRTKETQAALETAMAAYWEAFAEDSVQAVLAPHIGEALNAVDAESLAAFEGPMTGLLGPLGIKED